MSASHQVTDGTLAAGERVTTYMTQGGAAVTILGGLTVQEWAMAIGAFVSIVGLLGNWAIAWYWKSKHYQLADYLGSDHKCKIPLLSGALL